MLQGLSTRETRESAAEIKFLLTPALAAEILEWSRHHLAPDPHGAGPSGDEYATTSLYFDTPAMDVYHRRGSFGRSKYRVRRYGCADAIFLERKLRTSRMLIKRRTIVDEAALAPLSRAEFPPRAPGYWFQQRLGARSLRPVCQVSYYRVARMGTTSYGPMRLTIDRQIQARPTNDLAFLPNGGADVLHALVPVEMKFRVEMPVAFTRLVETFRLEAKSVSKYRLSMEALGQTGA